MMARQSAAARTVFRRACVRLYNPGTNLCDAIFADQIRPASLLAIYSMDNPHKTASSAFYIAFCVDDRYMSKMGATIASVVGNNAGMDFIFHVFAFSISEDNRRRIGELERRFVTTVMIHLVDPGQFREFHRFIKSSYYSAAALTRLVVPKVLGRIVERVPYLDADILCLGRLDELQMESGMYFNSGVIHIDVPAWIAAGISEKAAEIMSGDTKDPRFPDQDALNLALAGRTKFIPRKWNTIHGLIGDLDAGKHKLTIAGDATFIHFAGSVKPWSEWTEHEAGDLFRKYHDLSPWNDLRVEAYPQNYRDMRMFSRFLFRRRHFGSSSLAWHCKYLAKRRNHGRATR